MKGFEEQIYTFIILTIALIIISFSVTPLYASIEAASRNNARLNALELAGVINMIKASPSQNLVYKFDLPPRCTIDVTDTFVRVKISGTTYVTELIDSNVVVGTQQIDCSQRTISIEKNGNNINLR